MMRGRKRRRQEVKAGAINTAVNLLQGGSSGAVAVLLPVLLLLRAVNAHAERATTRVHLLASRLDLGLRPLAKRGEPLARALARGGDGPTSSIGLGGGGSGNRRRGQRKRRHRRGQVEHAACGRAVDRRGRGRPTTTLLRLSSGSGLRLARVIDANGGVGLNRLYRNLLLLLTSRRRGGGILNVLGLL